MVYYVLYYCFTSNFSANPNYLSKGNSLNIYNYYSLLFSGLGITDLTFVYRYSLINYFKKNDVEPLNFNDLHVRDIHHEFEEKLFVILLYNDEEHNSTFEFYARIWNTFRKLNIFIEFKEKPNLKMKVILSDAGNCKQIICHDIINLNNVSNSKITEIM